MGSDLGILPVDMSGGTAAMGNGSGILMAGLTWGRVGKLGMGDWVTDTGIGDSMSGLLAGLLLSNLTGGLAVPSSLCVLEPIMTF